MNPLTNFKIDIRNNLDRMQSRLDVCTQAGMHDPGDQFYNEILGLIDETEIAKSQEELKEVITKAKTLEIDMDAWLARLGQTTVSLHWPLGTV